MLDRRALLAGGGAALVLGGLGFRAWDRGVWSGGKGVAYAPWNNLEGSAADGITRPLRAAILAANPHDTQPWLFLEDLKKWGGEMEPEALKRARHVITENMRTVAAADALLSGNLAEVGRLMAEAHWSYSRDFEASCVEADAMVELAQGLPGLVGARLTGGGFGGCTVNLVERRHAPEFAALLAGRYLGRIGIQPQIHICHASGGAHRVKTASLAG